MEANKVSKVEAQAGKEIVIPSKGMSYGTIKRVVGERVKMDKGDGKVRSEPLDNVAYWIDADHTDLQ